MQILGNSIITGSIYILVGLSFATRFGSARFFDFSIGLFFTLSAYIALLFSRVFEFGSIMSCIFGVAASVIAAGILEYGLFRWLRRRTGSELLALLAALGVYVVGQNCISLAFGDGRESLVHGARVAGMLILGARVTGRQVVIVMTSLVVVLVLSGITRFSNMGLLMRGVREDSELSEIVGIRVDRVIGVASLVAGGLAGLAGVLYAVDLDMIPSMGLRMLVMAIVVVIVGGHKSIWGITIASLGLALAQHLATWFVGAKWMDAVAFSLLFLFLLLRPHGIAGIRSRTEGIGA